MEYGEIKRPRLEMGAEPLMRHQPQRPPLPLAGAEDVVKVSDFGEEGRSAENANEPKVEEFIAIKFRLLQNAAA